MRSPDPARPSLLRWSFPQYFGVKIMYRPNFFRFFLFYIVFGSFLFVILLFFFPPFSYSSLLILLFLSLFILLVGTILRLLILLFLYFKLFVVLLTWYICHSEGFFEGAKPFLIHLRSKLMYTVRPYVLTFLLYPFFISFFDLFFLLLSSYSSLHISLLLLLFLSLLILHVLYSSSFYSYLFILNCLLYYRHAY